MNQFNGMSDVELEMLKDQIEKAIPTLIQVAPKFAELVMTYYDEYKNYGNLTENERIKLAVDSAKKFFGG